MRHLTFFSALFFLAFNAHSQLKLGVQAGPNISSISALEKASDLKTDKSSQTSYQTSLLVEYQAIPELAIELGVQYSRQGTKWNDAEQNTLKINYLKIPLTLNYPISLGTGEVKVGTGMYYATALSGKRIKAGLEENLVFDSSPYSMFGKADLGLSFQTAYELQNGIRLAVDYQLGLKNIASDAIKEAYVFKNRTFSVGLGYYLKLKKSK